MLIGVEDDVGVGELLVFPVWPLDVVLLELLRLRMMNVTMAPTTNSPTKPRIKGKELFFCAVGYGMYGTFGGEVGGLIPPPAVGVGYITSVGADLLS